MSERYPGGFITGDQPTVNPDSADGVWTLEQQAGYQGQGVWPVSQYQISRSLRFNSADSAYLSRTPASAGNRKIWTWSGWVKIGALGTTVGLFEGNENFNGSNYFTALAINSSNQLYVQDISIGASYNLVWNPSAVFRDPSAWYHIVCVCDVTQASSSNAIKIYVNGVEQTLTFTAFAGAYVQNRDTFVNATWTQSIGTVDSANYFNGYMTEINFIDGQALTPSDFGKIEPTTGVWVPREYTGNYGTNGFYVNFSDNSNTTAATLGADYSGNGNNWTPNNFSVAAGAGNDSVVDVPVSYGVDTGAGGEVGGNYATLNPLNLTTGASLSNGNLTATTGTNPGGTILSTIAIPSSGKWYWEYVGTTNGLYCFSGVYDGGSLSALYFGFSGDKYVDGTGAAAYGAAYTTNDVIGVAADTDSNELTFYKNGSSQGAISYDFSRSTFFAVFQDGSSSFGTTQQVNFGQRPFAYTAPSGFKALCTTNLPEPTIVEGSQYFKTVLYTGDGTANRPITVGFQPDLVWFKSRTNTYNPVLIDAVRGGSRILYSNTTDVQINITGGITSFDSTGFDVSADGSANSLNASGANIVAWNWNAGGTTVTNTDGTRTSTVRASQEAGISIITLTTPTGNFSVGHGLGVAPKLAIFKRLNVGTGGWITYHTSLGADKYLFLNTTAAAATSTTIWQNTAPTSTVFYGSATIWGGSSSYLGYLFAEIEGYSKISGYTGNGSTDGPFVYCGFRPAFILIKNAGAATNWVIVDSVRDSYNVQNKLLRPNLPDPEIVLTYTDSLSNGFKIQTTDGSANTSGGTYVFIAFAENPFKYALAR
jgi:hypothetical protein